MTIWPAGEAGLAVKRTTNVANTAATELRPRRFDIPRHPNRLVDECFAISATCPISLYCSCLLSPCGRQKAYAQTVLRARLARTLRLALPLRGLAAALGLDDGIELLTPPVLALEGGDRSVLLLAEIGAVDDEALVAALHFKGELRHRRVGNSFEGIADPPVSNRIDPPVEIYVDPAGMKGRHKVGQRMVR